MCAHRLGALRQRAAAVAASLGQNYVRVVYAIRRHQRPVASRVPGLTAGLAPTLVFSPSRSGVPRQAVRRRRFRGSGRVPLALRKLLLQFLDLLYLLVDLPCLLVDLLPELFILPTKSFIVALQVVTTPPTALAISSLGSGCGADSRALSSTILSRIPGVLSSMIFRG